MSTRNTQQDEATGGGDILSDVPNEILSKPIVMKTQQNSVNRAGKLVKQERKEMKKLLAMIVEIEMEKIE